MANGTFNYEMDLLKHYVRVHGWLPFCRRRRQTLIEGVPPKKQRRLRYFTFCAVGAVDVLMLDVANVVRRSSADSFDTVYFFNRTSLGVMETQRRIPGANGFADNFIDVVLFDDEPPDPLDDDPLTPPEDAENVEGVRRDQRRKDIRRQFIRAFPFDVVNLDLEGFLFAPTDDFPGLVLRAMKKVFEWQRRANGDGAGRISVDAFTLMFTTKIGPPQIPPEYQAMLNGSLADNVTRDPTLLDSLEQRTGYRDLDLLRGERFDAFFKLALPKLIAQSLLDEDWYIDPAHGVQIFQFDRAHEHGTYSMLHFVADVRRQHPDKDRRAPRSLAPVAERAYEDVARAIFEQPEVVVTPAIIDEAELQRSLDRILARRRLYCPDCDEEPAV